MDGLIFGILRYLGNSKHFLVVIYQHVVVQTSTSYDEGKSQA